MKDPEGRTAMKRVPSIDIVVGDLIYRSAGEQGDFMMRVAEAGRKIYEGREVCTYRGDVFALRGSGAWPQAFWLGDITAEQVGTGEWMAEVDGTMPKGVRPEEADYEIPE